MDLFFNQLYLVAPISFIVNLVAELFVSKSYHSGKSSFASSMLLVVIGLIYGLVNVYYTNSICATLDGSPCTLTQQQIWNNVIGNFSVIIFPYGLFLIFPGFIGLFVGSLIGKAFHKPAVN